MANVKNETTTNTASLQDLKSALSRKFPKMTPEAKQAITDLNATAANIAGLAFSARSATYTFVAGLVDAAHLFAEGGEHTESFLKLFEVLSIPAPNTAKIDANPYLPLVRAADGEWLTEEKDGKTTTDWKPNRSSEKHASVCRFAVTNGYSGAALLEFLNQTKPHEISHSGKTFKVKPTLADIMRFDTKIQFPVPEREVLDEADWREINRLRPIAKLPFTEQFKAAFTLREGAIGSAIFMVRDGEVWIVGDGDRKGNELQRDLKKRRLEFQQKRMIAHEKPDTVAEVPVEVLIDE